MTNPTPSACGAGIYVFLLLIVWGLSAAYLGLSSLTSSLLPIVCFIQYANAKATFLLNQCCVHQTSPFPTGGSSHNLVDLVKRKTGSSGIISGIIRYHFWDLTLISWSLKHTLLTKNHFLTKTVSGIIFYA